MGISLLDMQRKQKNHGCSKIKKLKIKLYQNPERNLRKKVMVPKASGYLVARAVEAIDFSNQEASSESSFSKG